MGSWRRCDVLLVLVISVVTRVTWGADLDEHGRIQMGVADSSCDDGVNGISIDWDNSTTYEYECQPDEIPITELQMVHITAEECMAKSSVHIPNHRCLDTPISYYDKPPRTGNHRPLWPVYGEYLFTPPQRWLHSLEHGAAVFLYHPCAPKEGVDKMREIAKSCLRRYVITPYRNLTREMPYAIMTFGCRLRMGDVIEEDARTYLMKHAIVDGLERVSKDGQYEAGLLEKSEDVPGSDEFDTFVCPQYSQKRQKLVELGKLEKLTNEIRMLNDDPYLPPI